jgi:hypothetical protein
VKAGKLSEGLEGNNTARLKLLPCCKTVILRKQ